MYSISRIRPPSVNCFDLANCLVALFLRLRIGARWPIFPPPFEPLGHIDPNLPPPHAHSKVSSLVPLVALPDAECKVWDQRLTVMRISDSHSLELTFASGLAHWMHIFWMVVMYCVSCMGSPCQVLCCIYVLSKIKTLLRIFFWYEYVVQ